MSLYWSQASTNSSWPQNWDGTDPLIGNIIGTQAIPNLEPGESTILVFPWNVLNPTAYGNWHTCLLARIEGSTQDPITVYPNDLAQDVYMNNNISARNTEVLTMTLDNPPVVGEELYPHGGVILVGNVSNDQELNDFVFFVPENEIDSALTDEAEVTLTFDSEGWEIFSPYFENREDIKIVRENRVQLLNPYIELNEIEFEANQRIEIYVGFSFLTEEATSKNEFRYHISQKKSTSHPTLGEHWTGGVHFTVRKEERDPFVADAGGDKTIQEGEIITVTASNIQEDAIYQWFDSEGNLIHSGNSMTLSPSISKRYRLEVIALSDGFKDIDELDITVDKYYIKSISPNPTSEDLTVELNLSDASSAYLMVVGSTQNGVVNNYILSPGQSEFQTDISSFQPGIYSVILVCNGEYEDIISLEKF